MFSGSGAASVVLGGKVEDFGAAAGGATMGGATLGAEVEPLPPRGLQFGQTHCTVQPRTCFSFVSG